MLIKLLGALSVSALLISPFQFNSLSAAHNNGQHSAGTLVAALLGDSFAPKDSSPSDTLPQDSSAALFDELVLTLLDSSDPASLRHGMDTMVSPCDDFFLFVNGGWWKEARIPPSTDKGRQMAYLMTYARMKMMERLEFLLDSSRAVITTTEDPTLKTLGVFYESCMSAPELEPNYYKLRNPSAYVRDSTRSEQCLQRTMYYMAGAAGQAFVQDLQRSGAVERMEKMLSALRVAVEEKLRNNSIMSNDEKDYALERLNKLILRVGIPEELLDLSGLELSPDNYEANKDAITSFDNTLWANSLGGNVREKWKASLLIPNAFYMPRDHAIEIPTLMFSPPFFFSDGEDLLNFAGVGHIIGHEIFHSIAPQLPLVQNPRMKDEIDSFKEFNTSMGTFDGWEANGRRTFNEDVADLGGTRIAYNAWKTTVSNDPDYTPQVIDGFTPDQRFFIAMARIWRSKWTKDGIHRGPHAPNFARVKSAAMQNRGFQKAFGCKPGDPMYLSEDKLSRIW